MQLFSVTVFICYILSMAATAADISTTTTVQEPSTKHTFTTSLQHGLRKLTLAGSGVRIKQIGPIKAQVYSAAVYLDKGSLGKLFKDLKCVNEKELLCSKEFEEIVVEGSGDKTIMLRMARSVGADTMVGAIEGSVRPKMGGKDIAALKEFSTILLDSLRNGGAKNNMVLSFENSGNTKLTVSIEGKKKGVVQSPTLCRAFTSVYLGSKPVSPILKEQVAKTIIKWKETSVTK